MLAEGVCQSGTADPDCDNNGIEDSCDIADCVEDPDCDDCNGNDVPDFCDITAGNSPDVDGDGVPDECLACGTNAACLDGDICTFDLCINGACDNALSLRGDIAGGGGTCGPDGFTDIFDIFMILDAFQDVFADGCELANADLAGSSTCSPDGAISIFDIFAVLDAFAGVDACCSTDP